MEPVDYCTAWPEGWWATCCAAHDVAFEAGGSLTDFLAVNVELGRCVAALGGPSSLIVGGLMLAGTTAFGWLFWRRATRLPSPTSTAKDAAHGDRNR